MLEKNKWSKIDNRNFHLRKLKKEQINSKRRKEIIKIILEVNEIENKKSKSKIRADGMAHMITVLA
jgi:DNA polymerase II small subunit/DNA polymerase delta subunit B